MLRGSVTPILLLRAEGAPLECPRGAPSPWRPEVAIARVAGDRCLAAFRHILYASDSIGTEATASPPARRAAMIGRLRACDPDGTLAAVPEPHP